MIIPELPVPGGLKGKTFIVHFEIDEQGRVARVDVTRATRATIASFAIATCKRNGAPRTARMARRWPRESTSRS